MEHYLILARSVTYAQRMKRQLEKGGVRSQILRPPRDLTDSGCAYALRIAVNDLAAALKILRGAGYSPIQVYVYQFGVYQEVGE